jgi:hypothetical protein
MTIGKQACRPDDFSSAGRGTVSARGAVKRRPRRDVSMPSHGRGGTFPGVPAHDPQHDDVLRRLRALLSGGAPARVVNLCGPLGVGKSRLLTALAGPVLAVGDRGRRPAGWSWTASTTTPTPRRC